MGYISVQSYDYNAYAIRDAEDLILIGEYIGLALQSAWRKEKDQAQLESARKLLTKFDRLEEDLNRVAAGVEPHARADLETMAKQMAFLRSDRLDPAVALLRSS